MLSRSALSLTITIFSQASGFALLVPSAAVPTRTLQGARRGTVLFGVAGEQSQSILPEVSRRAAVITAAALAAGGTVVAPSPSDAHTPPLFEQVRALETANYIGQIGHPINEPNSKGDPAKHLPHVKVDENRNIVVWVPHAMTEEHFIQFIWLKEAKIWRYRAREGIPGDGSQSSHLDSEGSRGRGADPVRVLQSTWTVDE